MLQRLNEEIGLTGTALEWFRSYLGGRSSRVCVNGQLSDPKPLDFGVPQGSVVGPMCFSIYTSNVGKIIRKHGFSYHIYADDTQIYCPFNPKNQTSINSALSKLTSCVNEIKLWMTHNLLKLNEDKTEFLVISSPRFARTLPPILLDIAGSRITLSPYVRNLGIIFDSHLSMSDHITSMRRSINF